ncbi:MAG: hypothetical protein WBE76_06025 [Terracidiphilus sp.]
MRLHVLKKDFEQFPLNETVQQWLFRDFATCANEWLKGQACFEAVGFDIEAMVRDFFFAYMKTPFREQPEGSRFNNCLWLSILARAFDPSVVVDSGTFEGASAWALSFGALNAEVWSFDIDLSALRWRAPRVQYRQQDWTEVEFGARSGQRTLVYFDDHVDQARRLLEAQERGFGMAVFDDDFPVIPALQMAHGGSAFPKIEFVLSEELRREKEISWRSRARTFRWPVDVAYLDRARAAIAVVERLPNTSSITGIHQTPYSVVKIQPLT